MNDRTKKTAKRKPAKVWPHECFEDADTELAGHNTKLARVLCFDIAREGGASDCHMEPQFATEKLKPKARQGPKTVFFTYCPFCGRKLR